MIPATIRVGRRDAPRLLLSHGCGLASETDEPFWRPLAGEYDPLLHDMPSHGRNQPSPAPPNIPALVDDLCAAIRRADEGGAKPTVGIFHSMSALAALLLQQRESPFAGLILFDPPGGARC